MNIINQSRVLHLPLPEIGGKQFEMGGKQLDLALWKVMFIPSLASYDIEVLWESEVGLVDKGDSFEARDSGDSFERGSQGLNSF